ncbi:MAG: apbE 1 [Mucilaginibacter sp.]|nr:apbE 1 [Mucilaginibacter sp.]
MKLFQFTICSFLLLILCSGASISPVKTSAIYVSDYENVLGTSFEFKALALTPAKAEAAENAALSEIDRLNKILSGYDASSEFSIWMHGEKRPVKVSPELYEVLYLFDKWRVQSGGALDASAEVIGRVWKAAAKSNQQPTSQELSAAVATVKQSHWKLDEVNHTATHLDDAPLMLNSFAKSYIINKACNAALASGGITGVVINIGGDIVVKGDHTEQILISNPKADAENDLPIARLNISNKMVATSGNYRRGELVNGKWHSHIVDPRTGLPCDKVLSATVVADNATDAGALATAFNVLTPEESKALAATIPHAEFMLITSDGKRVESNGWKELELPERKIAITKSAKASFADKTWDPNYELVIGLELKQIEGFRVHSPYVAMWVVDKDKKPVRNIALWYRKPKYLDEMPAWYDTYYGKFADADRSVSSTTSATRPAGKYTLKWDGKDDKGEFVKRGIYTIMIEVAREHGTHQLMTKEIDFTKKLQPITLPGNIEVTSVVLDYVKKTK